MYSQIDVSNHVLEIVNCFRCSCKTYLWDYYQFNYCFHGFHLSKRIRHLYIFF